MLKFMVDDLWNPVIFLWRAFPVRRLKATSHKHLGVRTSPLSIKAAERNDFEILSSLERQASQRFLRVSEQTGMSPAQLQDTLEEHEQERSLSEGGLWIAEWNGVPAGFVATHLYPDSLYIREIDVLEEFGRKGIGRALINQAVAQARGLKLDSVFLRTFREVAWNAPFYQRLGFEEVEEQAWNDIMNSIVDVETAWGLKAENRLFMRLLVAQRDLQRPDPLKVALALFQERYVGADVLLLAGSVMRGEGSATSDLDIVVLYRQLAQARRESFTFQGWPVEVFVHDPSTLRYFMQDDVRSGVPSMPAMISEGQEVPKATDLSRELKAVADRMLAAGPPTWSEPDRDRARYGITDLCNDLEGMESMGERLACGARLHIQLGEFCCRARGCWAGSGKSLHRRLQHLDPELALRFEKAFGALYRGDHRPVVELAEAVLAPYGGRLFEGYTSEAPPDWRVG